MSSPFVRTWLKHLVGPSDKERPRRRNTSRLRLEELESRTLLSAGSLDTTFGIGGRVVTDFGAAEQARAVAIQPNDDKIVVAGVTDAGGGENFALARYNPDGTPDLTFSFDGKVATDFFGGNDEANAVAIQSDGKIVVAGFATSPPDNIEINALARYNGNGTLDLTFGHNGIVTGLLRGGSLIAGHWNALTILSNGQILVAGVTGSVFGPRQSFELARYNSGGSLDLSFGPNGDGEVSTYFFPDAEAHDLAIQADGKIVVVGNNTAVPEVDLARYSRDGILDPTFGQGGQLTTQLNAGIKKLWANGTIARLQKKWFNLDFSKLPDLK